MRFRAHGLGACLVLQALFLLVPLRAIATIERMPIWTNPTTYVVNEQSVANKCNQVLHAVYDVFDNPVAVAMIPKGATTNAESFFVIDNGLNLLRCFGTIDREVAYLTTYGEGFGSGLHQFNEPRSVTVSPRGPGGLRYVYVLDTGNGRVEKLHVDLNQHTVSHVAYFYLSQTGSLRDARDIDYVELHDDDNTNNDFLLIADTDNHRIIALKPDSTVLWEVGGPDPGDGVNQFRYPSAVTGRRINNDDNSALIYVADRGNHRIVALKQNDLFGIEWAKVMDLPVDNDQGADAVQGFGMSGLEDIEVDAGDGLSGVFVLDSKNVQLLHIDYRLESILHRFDDLSYKCAPLCDLEAHNGELAVVSPYTMTSGIELFKVKASIYELGVSPNRFTPPLEWAFPSLVVSSACTLDVWVQQGSDTVKTLLSHWFTMPGTEYAIWDGTKKNGQLAGPGFYQVKARIRDAYWPDPPEVKSTDVEVLLDPNHLVLTTRADINNPDWSSDGNRIVYSAEVGGATSVFSRDSATGATVNLASGGGGTRQLDPAWSRDGQEIAWTKEVPRQPLDKSFIYLMNSDGSNKALLSDTTAAPAYFWEHNPEWMPQGDGLSWLRRGGTTQVDTLKSYVLATGARSVITAPGPWISDFAWSPNGDKVAFVTTQDGLEIDELYTYDTVEPFYFRLTEDPDSGRVFHGIDWSPDGRHLLFTKWGFWSSHGVGGNPEFRSHVMVMPATGGVAVPVSDFTNMDAVLREGVAWSPDGTKILVPVAGIESTDLLVADFIRGERAFPGAFISSPLAQQVVGDDVPVIGTVNDNIGVQGGPPLSDLQKFYVQWGRGSRPETWSDCGVELRYGCPGQDPSCPIINDVLAVWNTGVVSSGEYTLRLVASDGTDSNVVYRRVSVAHRSYTVKTGGSGDFTTIQAAVNAAQMGDTIKIYAGGYTGTVNMKQTVVLIGVEDGVNINGGNAPGIKIFDHAFPCRVEHVTVRNPQPAYQARGISIDNASPIVQDLLISGHHSSMEGAGVYVTGTSFPKFVRCIIRDNRANAGAGVYVKGTGKRPAPSFMDCRIVNNKAEGTAGGGGIRIAYDAPLDTTYAQPQFTNCVIDSNEAVQGSAVYLVNCHAPVFSGCSISSNLISSTASSKSTILGTFSGFRGYNCTLTQNGGGTPNTQFVMSFGPIPGFEQHPVRLERSIVAFNELRGLEGHVSGYYLCNRSDFFGNVNENEDRYWLTHGVGNLYTDPAFCDAVGANYTLYAYSPCAPAVSSAGLIGAYDVSCVPACSVTLLPCGRIPPPQVLTTCPRGDADTVAIRLDFNDSEMTRHIDPEEIWLGANYDPVKFFGSGPIYADSCADSTNAFRTKITHRELSGCCTTSVSVMLDGMTLDERPVMVVRSLDLNGDGDINSQDLAIFASHYPPYPPGSYGPCADFNADLTINSQDIGIWGVHQGHHYDPPGAYEAVVADGTADPPFDVHLSFMESRENPSQHKLYVTVTLDGLEPFEVMSLSLHVGLRDLAYVGMVPSASFPARSYVVPIEREGRDELFIASFARKVIGFQGRILGTLEFDIKNNSELSLTENTFQIVRGGILTLSGVDREFNGLRPVVADNHEATYGDYLAQNHPNPFNPATTIEYSISKDSYVNLSIFNVKGQRIRTLENGLKKGHNYTIVWDGKNDHGESVASGTYFCRVKTDTFTETKKLVLIR